MASLSEDTAIKPQQQREGEGKLKNHRQILKWFGSEMKHVALLTVQRSTSIKLMAKRPGNVEKHMHIYISGR